MGPKSRSGGGDRLCQTSPIPRSPDGDNNASLPKAKAHNSSHILVSWADVYQGCKHYEVRDVTIMVDGQRKKYEFVVKNRLISESPCSNHSISIELNFKNTEREPLTSEKIFFKGKEKSFCEGGKPHLNSKNEQGTTPSLSIGLGTSVPLH